MALKRIPLLLWCQEASEYRTRCNKGIFSVSQSSDDIYLVLKIDKVLQGDSSAIDLYTKTDLVPTCVACRSVFSVIFTTALRKEKKWRKTN